MDAASKIIMFSFVSENKRPTFCHFCQDIFYCNIVKTEIGHNVCTKGESPKHKILLISFTVFQ